MADSSEELEGDCDFEEFDTSIAQAFLNTSTNANTSSIPKKEIQKNPNKAKSRYEKSGLKWTAKKNVKAENQDKSKNRPSADSKDKKTSQSDKTSLKENEGTETNTNIQDKDAKSKSEEEDNKMCVSEDEKKKSSCKEESKVTTDNKRKLTENIQSSPAKVKKVETPDKTDSTKDRNLFSSLKEGAKEMPQLDNDDDKKVTAEEVNRIDEELVKNMFEEVKKYQKPRESRVFTIRFGPLEMVDLADSGIQDLIKYQPKITFFFKKPTDKDKDKKGYGEMCAVKASAINTFLRKLCKVNLVERRVDVSVSATYNYEYDFHGNFTLWLDKVNDLVKLIDKTEDPIKYSMSDTNYYIRVDELPFIRNIRYVHLKAIFPFTTFVGDKKKGGGIKNKGPIDVFYPSSKWLYGVTECFTDFSYNGTPLTINIVNEDKDKKIQKTDSTDAGTKTETGVTESADSNKKKTDSQSKSKKSKEDKMEVDNEERGSGQGSGQDEAIDNMTRDVCADMLESLKKLKQLETDNPNMQRIIEMQEQLAKLQMSLSKPKSGKSGVDPWAVDSTDAASLESQNKKLKTEKLTPQERNKIKMEELQRHIEEAQEAEIEKEEITKKIQEMEMKIVKEQEEKRRSGWARKMIEDLKTEGGGAAENSATKKEAQKLLQAREEKLRQKKAEEERRIQEEKERKAEAERRAEEEKKKAEAEKEKAAKEEIAKMVLPFQDAISGSEGDAAKAPSSKDKGSDTAVKQATSSTKQADSKKVDVKPVKKPEPQINFISEEFYKEKVLSGKISELPQNFRVELKFYENRGCPVQGCPASRFFKRHEDLLDHWEVFHKENMSVRFCPKCVAFFNHTRELDDHLKSRHSIHKWRTREGMINSARTKVIKNASYRDPGYFSFE